MRYFCPACGTAQTKPDEEVPATGMTVDCAKCGFQIKIKAPKAKAVSENAIKTMQSMERADGDSVEDKTDPHLVAATEVGMPAAGAEEEAWMDEGEAGDEQDEWADAETQRYGAEPEQEAAAPLPEDEQPTEAKKPPKAKKASPKKAKPKKAKAAKAPRMPGADRLPFPGICRSGDRFRFRDLFYALRAPLDLRKTLVTAAGILAGSAILVLILWISVKTGSRIVVTIGSILGFAIYFACLYLGLGIATRQTDREMMEGKKLPLSEGIGFVKARLVTVVGFPFLFVAGMVACGAGIAVFQLIARVPFAGPIVYGLTYGVTFGLGVLAVLIGLLLIFCTFSYIPPAGELGLVGLARHLWQLVRKNPGWYTLQLLVSAAVAGVLMVLLAWLVGRAFAVVGAVDGLVGGGEYSKILLSTPGGLFPLWALLFETGLGSGSGAGWQFSIAGWLVFLTLIVVFAVIQGFVLTYFQAAGAVNYRLLTQDEEPGE